MKKGHRRKNWNRRFFVLQDTNLHYFEDEKSFRDNGMNASKGSIKLIDYTVHDCINNNDGYKFCFYLMSKNKPFLVRAENQQDKDDWLEIISVISKRSDPIDYNSVADK